MHSRAKYYLGCDKFRELIDQFIPVCCQCMVIGSDGVDAVVLCHVIKNSLSVTSLNFTGCGLSSKSAEVLAETIKVSQ